MKSNISIVFGFVLFMTSSVFADRMRNGGDYVVCNYSAAQTYFYDYYELTRILKVKPALPSGVYHLDVFENAELVIRRQFAKDKVFTDILLQYLKEFKSSSHFSEVDLQIIDDNPAYKLEKECHLYQGAVSGPGEGANDGLWVYNIYKEAWQFMDTNNRVALVLHEMIYRVASGLGKTTSFEVKRINQKMMTAGMGLSKEDDLYNLRKELGFLLPGE